MGRSMTAQRASESASPAGRSLVEVQGLRYIISVSKELMVLWCWWCYTNRWPMERQP